MILLTLISSSEKKSVTVAECKKDLRLQHSIDDEYISGLIDAAYAYLGGVNGVLGGKVLDTESWQYKTLQPSSIAILPLTPAQELTSMSYYDLDNSVQQIDISDYTLYSDEDCAYIEPNPNISWPAMFDRIDALTINFVAGFTSTPDNLNKAIRFIVAHWFENRTVTSDRPVNEIPMAAESLINISRKGWVSA
tara:strand:+ start:5487 stop:6065 length:579 start_codon:yes stop_codon:yes gene_type:complete